MVVVITPIGFVDASMATAMFTTKYRVQLTVFEGQSLRTLPLMAKGQPLPVLKEWKSARNLLARIKTATTAEGPVAFGDVAIMSLDPGGFIPWSTDAETEYRRLHLCLIPSPGCWIYAGGSGAVIPVGQLTLVDHKALYSVVNFGQFPCVHLVADVKPE